MAEEIGANCRDGCGSFLAPPENEVEAEAVLTSAGWVFLASAYRWRCPTCVGMLKTEATRVSDPEFVDNVAPRSRGAPPKNTAETIKPPVDVAKEADSQLDWEV